MTASVRRQEAIHLGGMDTNGDGDSCRVISSNHSPPVLSLSLSVFLGGISQSWHIGCPQVGNDRNCVLARFYPYCVVTSTHTTDFILTASTCFPEGVTCSKPDAAVVVAAAAAVLVAAVEQEEEEEEEEE